MAFLGDKGGWYVEHNDDLSGPFETLEEAEQEACNIMGIEYVAPIRADWHRTVKELQAQFDKAGIEIYRIGGGQENWKKPEFYR